MKRMAFLFFVTAMIFFLCVPTYAGKKQKLPILLYHHILPEADLTDDNAFIISQENFKAHMTCLYENGYSTVTLEELRGFLFNGEALPEKSVLITFDDGYYSNILYAYPILKEYGFTATIFIITEALEKDPPMWPNPGNYITTEQMEETADVFEYASHTHALHKNTDGKSLLAKAGFDEIVADTNESVELVSNSYTFAYPHGQFNDTIIDALKESGIEIAFATTHGCVSQDSNPFKLHRYTIYRTTTFKQIKEILAAAYK